jgi:hypothetical protein
MIIIQRMPNHCYNKITIKASPELIERIVHNKFSFHILNPVEDISNENCIEHWGTKWDCWDFNIIKRTKDGIIFDCTTAWSPPTKIIDSLIQRSDAWVKCEWYEEGGLAGIMVGDKKEIKELIWEDMILEELAQLT